MVDPTEQQVHDPVQHSPPPRKAKPVQGTACLRLCQHLIPMRWRQLHCLTHHLQHHHTAASYSVSVLQQGRDADAPCC